MKSFLLSASLGLVSLCAASATQAQDATQTSITFVAEEEERARVQLERILARYDLDPWMFTRRVQIATGGDPRSHPILTLNTDYLDSDAMQLSVFLHEQAHWFVSESVPHRAPENATDEVPVIQELRGMYPDPPASVDYGSYAHLIVAWVELDALVELLGEEEARRLLLEKVDRLVDEPLSDVDQRYGWYNIRVLEDSQEIGSILARHDLIITPDKGLIVGTNEE